MKEKIKCLCEKSWCRKCLGSNCEDDNCETHTIENKLKTKINILDDLKITLAKIELMIKKGQSEKELNKLYNYKRLPRIRIDIKKYTKEIKILKKIQSNT